MSATFYRREPDVSPNAVGVDTASLDRIDAECREGIAAGGMGGALLVERPEA